MTQEQITEGNKLIAKFMGMKRHDHASYATWSNKKGEHIFENVLQYDSKWEWLMPVVDKIGKEYTINIHSYPDNGFDMVIKEGNYRRGFGEHPESRILSAWIAVVDFIKWDNKEK